MWVKVTGILVFVGVVISGIWYMEDRDMKRFVSSKEFTATKTVLADSLKQVNQGLIKTNARIDRNDLEQRAEYYKRQMADLRAKCGTAESHKMPAYARQLYDQYKIELDRINLKLRSIK